MLIELFLKQLPVEVNRQSAGWHLSIDMARKMTTEPPATFSLALSDFSSQSRNMQEMLPLDKTVTYRSCIIDDSESFHQGFYCWR